jgi:REJ domain/IPT/TIG domain
VVTVGEQTSNAIDFVYEAPVILTSMSPSSGSEDGGALVTLTGQFVNFNPATSGVYFGGKQIDDSLIVSYTDSQIVYRSPHRGDIGSLFSYPVSVVIGDLTSNSIQWTYESTGFSIYIDGSGSSVNKETGNYEVGACGNSLYRAQIPSSALAQNATFTWTLRDSSNVNVLAGTDITTDSEVFYLPYSVLQPTNELFGLTVTVVTSFFTTTSTINIIRRDAQNIGVKIFDPDIISPSDPNTTLTIQADVGVPGCLQTGFSLESEDITYVWVYRGADTYVFSYLNTTVDETIVGPTLLGREFKIPQEFMEYGTYNLSLTAYYTNNKTISGSDSTTVRIQPTTLLAVINAGQTESFVSSSTDVAMTALNSRDPDVLKGDQNEGLSYSWECKYAWDTELKNAQVCGSSLLGSSSATSFTVNGDALGAIRNTTKVYIRYSLVVRKTSLSDGSDDIQRTSRKVYSTLVLSEQKDVKYEPLKRIEIYDNLTAPTDPASVKYFQDVIVAPVSNSADTTWSFELLEPRSASTLLQVTDNLISYPGYWAVGARSGRDALGLKANALTPGTGYKFLIRSSRPGFEENEEVLELTTVAQPTVTISRLPTASGTTNDTYVISAFTNYDGDFKFFFTLTDEFGFSSCVDGCQGQSIVRFRLLSAGSYQIKCDVYDSLGFSLLASTVSATNLTVVSELGEGNSLAVFEDQIESMFVSGDHADFQQLGVDMVKYTLGEGGSLSPAEDSGILANFTAKFNHIVANAVPNSEQSAGYVKTASALTLLTTEYNITYTQETLYYLVNITVNAVTRTPDTVALRQLEDLLVFYGTTPELVLAAWTGGTTRRRLLQVDEENGSNSEFNVLMADMYEVMKSLIGVVVLKPASCGYVEEIATKDPATTHLAVSARLLTASRQGTANETRKTPAARYTNPSDTVLSRTRWTVGHLCNPEQGLKLEVPVGASGEVSRFGWCRELFEERFKNLYFMLVHTPNYAYLSGIRQNTTLTDGLHSISISKIAGDNTFTDAALPLANCYYLDIPLLRALTEPPDNSVDLSKDEAESQVPSACQLIPQRRWAEEATNLRRYYQGLFFEDSNLTLADSGRSDDMSVASFTTQAMGVYTVATRIAFNGGFFSLDGYLLNVQEASGVTLSLLVLVAAATVASWLIGTRMATLAGPPVAVGGADFTYVERDVYGRGTAIEMMDAQDTAPALFK